MGRRARREAQRRAFLGAANTPAWTPPAGRIRSSRFVNTATPGEIERQQQDLLAGTVFAAGAGVMMPEGGPPGRLSPMFTVFVNEDDTTFGPAPQLREAFQVLDEHGATKPHQLLTVGTSWAILGIPDNPPVKLKLEFHEPMTGSTAIVLVAQNYAACWQHIVDGGLIGITTVERLRRKTASFADSMEASILLGIGSSPGLQYLTNIHGW
jgi:hypothetical protein